MLTVYLSGPITGLSFEAAMKWRTVATKRLRESGLRVLNPLRGKSFLGDQLKGKEIQSKDLSENSPMLSDKALMSRDKLDVFNSDIILVNFMDAIKVSTGTIFELAWAEDHDKLVVIAAPKADPIHGHSFIRESGVIFNSFEPALDYVVSCGVEDD